MGAALFPHTLPLPCSHGSRERHVPVHHTYTMPNRNQPVQGLFLPCCWGVWFFANLLFSGPIYMQFLLDSLCIFFFDISFLMVHKDRLERDLWFCGERLPHSHQKRQRGKVWRTEILGGFKVQEVVDNSSLHPEWKPSPTVGWRWGKKYAVMLGFGKDAQVVASPRLYLQSLLE